MPWTAPKTWATNEVVTAANMNTHLRDDMAWLGTDKPRCEARRSASQSISTSTPTAIQFNDSDIYDVGGMHDPAVNNTRLTVPAGGAGLYLVGGRTGWESNNTGLRAIDIRLNGTSTGAFERWPTVQNTNTFHFIQWMVPMVAGDYVDLAVTQDSGVSLSVSGAAFWAIWMAT